jgi:hypothetical protein
MRMIRIWALFLTAALALANAGLIGYASDGTNIYTIDPSNGAVLNTETLSTGALLGLAVDSSGALYGSFAIPSADFFGQIGAIDPVTGNVTLLGGILTDTFGNQWNAGALAFDPSGSLYSFSANSILSVDSSSGFVTDQLDASPGSQALAFDANCTAWLSSNSTLSSIGQSCGGKFGTSGGAPTGSATGSATGSSIAWTGGTSAGGVDNLSSGPIVALSSTNSGLFYGIAIDDGGNPNLVSFDPDSLDNPIGVNTLGALPIGVNSLAVGGDFTPEPAGVACMSIGLAVVFYYRRRRVR